MARQAAGDRRRRSREIDEAHALAEEASTWTVARSALDLERRRRRARPAVRPVPAVPPARTGEPDAVT